MPLFVFPGLIGVPPAGRTAVPADPVELEAKVIQVLPHDVGAFTEGLEVLAGSLYESSGIYRQSWVQKADLSSGRVSRRVALPASWFGEGLALVDGGLWHLTWREHTAVLRDSRTLGELRRVTYDGEGWGLCHDRARGRLMMSDGSATLSLRDPQSFRLLGRITVHDGDGPVSGLNELECTGTDVWANVWPTEEIARIDPSTGRVKATLHIGALPDLPPAARRPGNVNGIAVDPSTHDLLLTGKYWPHVYRVRTQPAER
ncbi:glutaminyl-peptide cyclotransferase [Streptomyces sp. NPDC086519]|uniref:glutaminyl-peptide cyclotransferase n=1 Tax=Streptomyces sp. NPDC086519 TaxID=3154863 RepID=UPI003419F586